MLCKPNMDLFNTMSCFEVMDAKMDARMHRGESLTLSKAREQGILIPAEELSSAQIHALMQELMV